MGEPLAYLNGRMLPASGVMLSLVDAGFVQGATVAEQLRTFAGRVFHLEDHLARLAHSLELVGIDPGVSRRELVEVAGELAVRNHALLGPGDDLGLSILVTPGVYAAYDDGGSGGPTVCMHTYALPFHLWAEKYQRGQALAVTSIQQVPAECWPPSVKCRSRMHYFLADRQASRIDPGARAVLLDREGWVTEASTANLVLYTEAEGLVSPPETTVLPGISLAAVRQLAARRGIPAVQRRIRPEEVAAADEVLLTSTPFCLLPVTRFQGRPVSSGMPGPVFARLLADWSDHAGVDIAEQSRRFAARPKG